MQRDKPKLSMMAPYFPLWWAGCDACDKQFRFEWGWRGHDMRDRVLVRVTRTLCKRCAPDLGAAEFLAEEMGQRAPPPPPRPGEPPPPPDGPPVRVMRDTDEMP